MNDTHFIINFILEICKSRSCFFFFFNAITESMKSYLNRNAKWDNNYQTTFLSLSECYRTYRPNGVIKAYVCKKGLVSRKAPNGDQTTCDVELVRAIRGLLYEEGYTIGGARQRLSSDDSSPNSAEVQSTVRDCLNDLEVARSLLQSDD